jgi:hypothetical protein
VDAQTRPALFDAYWRFAASRQMIFDRRWAGQLAPWTDDPILKEYKFCNTFRAADRVTQYLLSQVIYHPAYQDLSAEDVFCRIVLFRLFSKPDTWRALDSPTEPLTVSSLEPEKHSEILSKLKARQPIYTSAFILAPPTHSVGSKHEHHLRLVKQMFTNGGIGRTIAQAKSLRQIVEALMSWPTIGPFLAYQIAIDLNYSPYLDFSENDYTLPGPGAIRGIRKVFVDPGGHSPQYLIQGMVEEQETHFARLGLGFQGLFGRPLHAIDCQGLFCEIDKYSRVAFPELKSERVRIKQAFRPTGPLPMLVFPARWGLAPPSPVDLGRADADHHSQLTFSTLELAHDEAS